MLGKPAVTPAQRVRAVATPATDTAKAVTQGSEKIIVSNLPGDVNEAQVKVCQRFLTVVYFSCLIYFIVYKELFNQTVGPLKDITLHYDATGRSKGIATVTFQRKGDGTKAFQQYNNRLIDGS